ncbi:MAG: hypothetical protein ACYSTS_16400 [Planctomycetota bacterium]|jgi:hypothetical protein
MINNTDKEKRNALQGIETAIKVNRAIRAKLEEVIAEKLWKRRNVDKERSAKASVNARLARLRRRKLDIDAASVVVSAPSVAEIRQVNNLIKEINDLALADAMRAAGLDFLKSAAARAAELRGKVKT